MKKNFQNYKYLALLFLFLAACKAPVQERQNGNMQKLDTPLLEANQYMRERHRDLIEAFVRRVDWEMQETSSGLWIEILSSGERNRSYIQEGDFVSYTYSTTLLNGTAIYSADSIEPKEIVVGKGNVEAGIEEGILNMRKGDRARLIIPPYLGHGNFGDMKKIPGSAILLVDINILDVKR